MGLLFGKRKPFFDFMWFDLILTSTVKCVGLKQGVEWYAGVSLCAGDALRCNDTLLPESAEVADALSCFPRMSNY